MPRSIPPERRTVVVRMLKGEIDPDVAASELGVPRKSVMDLKRRYLRSKLPKIKGKVEAPVAQPVSILRDR